MENQTVVYFNKSRDDIDQKCHRACYWNELALTTGIEPATGAYELAFGEWWHDAVAKLLLGESVEAAAAHGCKQLQAVQEALTPDPAPPGWDLRCREHQLLMNTLITLFPTSALMRDIRSHYDIVAVEQEISFREPRGDYELVFSAKPDVLTRDRRNGKLVYVEFKTTGFYREGWFKPYKRSPQLFGAALAVEQHYGETLDHVIVQPINKGSAYKDQWDSPACYVWRNVQGPSVKWSLKRPSSWAGWEKVFVGELEWGPALQVLEGLGASAILYPEAPPIYVNHEVVQEWWEQRVRRRLAIQDAVERGITEDELSSVFPQNFSQCEPMMGRACDFVNCCWIQHVGMDPLNHGFVQKTPHSQFDPRRTNDGVE